MLETKPFGGSRSHPELTQNKIWLATTVWESESENQIFNLIYPAHSDPNFHFRNKENSPWLNDREINQINFPHTAKGQERLSVARNYTAFSFLTFSQKILFQEKILKQQYQTSNLSFETKFGGWLFNQTLTKSPSEIMIKLYKRQIHKSYNNMIQADEIRKSLLNKEKIEIRDLTSGTMWFNPF